MSLELPSLMELGEFIFRILHEVKKIFLLIYYQIDFSNNE